MNLESRILDGKPAGYCSSSEGEEDDFKVVNDEDEHQANVMKRMGPSSNTGAKGVLNEFKAFREQTRLAYESRNQKLIEQAKKGMMVGSKEEREKAQKEDAEDEEDFEMTLEGLKAKRLREMRKIAANRVIEMTDKKQYSDAVDGSSEYLLCVLIYEPDSEDCEYLTRIIKILAADHSKTKFVRATSTLLEMSIAFKTNGVPCLQFYSHGNLIGNFVKVSSILGQDYDTKKLTKFLRGHHINLVAGGYATDSENETEEDD
ncbi:CRE-MAU-8 protein [Caenorhabditis remanei]|uniref:CRE-MAU-8 protein n=1 Tax=Caenorhabditis remanei TaxID=31234 RepID=E3M686_CAERE|nr:CRE-MAU-8 protein [Caenorhabditis remanei]